MAGPAGGPADVVRAGFRSAPGHRGRDAHARARRPPRPRARSVAWRPGTSVKRAPATGATGGRRGSGSRGRASAVSASSSGVLMKGFESGLSADGPASAVEERVERLRPRRRHTSSVAAAARRDAARPAVSSSGVRTAALLEERVVLGAPGPCPPASRRRGPRGPPGACAPGGRGDVLRRARPGRDQLADDDVLLEADEVILGPVDGGLGEHPRRLLERGGGQEAG